MSEPMDVTRVQDDNGTHIEPPLDQAWDEVTKLRWHAAVVAHDIGLTVDLHPHLSSNGRYHYGITLGEINKGGQTSISGGTYHQAWHALTLISIGAEAVRHAIAYEEAP